MKLTLVVLSSGKWEGKNIPIARLPFVIGRDPSCHLRPASPLISQRHCAFLARGARVFLRDFDSTNGTFINGQPLKGEVEVHDDQHLQIGPVAFRVRLERTSVPVDRPTPLPPTKAPATDSADDAAAALLLSWEEKFGPLPTGTLTEEGVAKGRTVLLLPEEAAPPEAGKPADANAPPPRPAGDTTSSAKAILEKYLRRERGR